MNLLSVLQPSPEARTIHRRLGHVLECQRFELLQAKANIWEPGETPEPRPERGPKPPPISKPRGRASHDVILAHIGAVPTTVRDIMAATGLKMTAAYNGMNVLLSSGRIKNLSRSGHIGRYVLTGVVPVVPPKVVKPRKVRPDPNADTTRTERNCCSR